MKPTAERYQYAFDPAGESTAARIVRLVGREQRVLELGPGPGSITRVLKEHAGCRITAIELDPAAAEQARPWCEYIQVGSLDDPVWDAFLGTQTFDVIVMADVLEHLADPLRTLRQAAARLAPGGHCVISLPNVAHNGIVAALLGQTFPYADTGLLDRTHIRFFARQNLPQFLADAGLLLAECQEVEGAPQHTEFAPHWFRLPEEQRKSLERNPAGNTYQFVLLALPDTAANRQTIAHSALVAAIPTAMPFAIPAETRQLLRHLHEQTLLSQWRQREAQREQHEAQSRYAELLRDYQQLRGTFFGKLARVTIRLQQLRRRSARPAALPQPPQDVSGVSGFADLSIDQRVSLSLAQYDQPHLPLITVMLDPGERDLADPALHATVASICAQTWSNLQILFLRHSLATLMPALNAGNPWDVRWRALPGPRILGGSPAAALEFVEGELVLWLRPGDQLAPDALQEIARIAQLAPRCQSLTFDHVTSGRPFDLPGWSHEFHAAHNVLGHAVAFRTPALLAVLNTAAADAPQALETPYAWLWALWRAHGDNAFYHHRRCLLAHADASWQEQGISEAVVRWAVSGRYPQAVVATASAGHLAIHHPPPVPYPLVSILIPTRNGADLVRVCLDSLLGKTTYPNYEILLIDNGSDDPLALECFARYAQEAHVRLLRDDSPFNFSAINNRAAREARGEYLLLLNNDTEVITPDWLERMLGYASQPENGAIGARLWYPDDTLQHAGVACPGGGPNHPFAGLPRGECGPLQRACITQRYLAVTAACLLVRASDYWRVGGLEESYAVGFNDVDFCFRLHASGLRNICVAEVELYHHESPSRGHDASPARKARAAGEMARLASRWGELLHNDPYV